MFVQTITGTVRDRDRYVREAERWPAELKPGATGYLGCTWGISADGTAFMAARFEDADAAKSNAERPEQGEWWEQMEPALDAPSFQDCAMVDTMMGGGSDDAGFVQVIIGRVKDEASARKTIANAEAELSTSRPDILGMTMAWHGDGGGFTQLVYFRSEADARSGEREDTDGDADREYREMMAGEPTFIDLTDPHFD
jgi:hypothetical protein